MESVYCSCYEQISSVSCKRNVAHVTNLKSSQLAIHIILPFYRICKHKYISFGGSCRCDGNCNTFVKL